MSALATKAPALFAELVEPWLIADSAAQEFHAALKRGIYIYGAGELGALALEYCEACDIRVLGVLDRARSGSIRSESGREYAIFSPDSAVKQLLRTAPVAVAIATLPFGPIREQLNAAGWNSVLPFYNLTSRSRAGHPLRSGWSLGRVTQEEFQTVDWLCRQWSDEISWRHFEAYLAWHRDNTEIDLLRDPIDPNQRYAIPELVESLRNRLNECVDVGSHRGESIARLNKAGLCFDKYVLIEPDDFSRSFLSSRQQSIVPEGASCSILGSVLGSGKHMTGFEQGLGYCSQVWSESNAVRQVIPLDELSLNPDLLKIHTEGTELEIIRGAAETISRSQPCLAFSVYHQRDGFFDDIAVPMKMFLGYRWFFRLHSHQGTGAFVYAVPESDSN